MHKLAPKPAHVAFASSQLFATNGSALTKGWKGEYATWAPSDTIQLAVDTRRNPAEVCIYKNGDDKYTGAGGPCKRLRHNSHPSPR